MPNPTPPDAERPDPELPRGVALAWGIATHPQRGPKRELSIERIVDAAIEIADAEGLGAVSMSRVAASLGFTTMSLYRYVTSKDDLILLMQESASVVPVPDDTLERSWRDGVTAWVLAMRDAYREHPWIVDIPISGAPITPNSLTIVDWFLREVRSLPLSDGEKMSALLLVTSYVRATGAQERDIGAAAAAASDPADVTGENFFAALSELVTPERFPYLSPLLAAGGYVAEPGAGPSTPTRTSSSASSASSTASSTTSAASSKGAPWRRPSHPRPSSRSPATSTCARPRRRGGRPRRRSARPASESERRSSTRWNARSTPARSRSASRPSANAANGNVSSARRSDCRMPRLSAGRSSPGPAR